MQNNTVVREAPLSISGFFSVFSDSRIARFLNSSFLMLGVVLSFMLMFIPNYLERVGISLPTTSFYFLVCGFTACFVCGFAKNRFAHLLTSRTRVLIQAASTVLGLFLFALMPSAKMLVVSCAFMGIALGIHDYYYIYVLYLICNGKVKANLRKLAEYTVYMGAGVMLPIIMVAFMVNNVRITFLILTLIVAVLAFLYPLSSFSGKIDERDISLKPEKRQREKPAPAAPQMAAPVAPETSQVNQSLKNLLNRLQLRYISIPSLYARQLYRTGEDISRPFSNPYSNPHSNRHSLNTSSPYSSSTSSLQSSRISSNINSLPDSNISNSINSRFSSSTSLMQISMLLSMQHLQILMLHSRCSRLLPILTLAPVPILMVPRQLSRLLQIRLLS